MSEKCVRNHVCHTQDAQLRELRRELAESQAVEETLRAYIQHLEDRHREDLVCMGEMSAPTYEELRQRAEQAEAQMAMLVGKLIDVATGYRRDAAEEGCDAGNFDGGSTDTCAHCQLLQQAEGIDSLLATLPASANQMLEREQAMREALEWYAEDGRYMLTRWTDYGGGTFSEAEVIIDHGQRAREALRKEDTATDA